MPKRLMCPDVRVLWNIHGFVGGRAGSDVGNEIKRRGLFLQDQECARKCALQTRLPSGKPPLEWKWQSLEHTQSIIFTSI